MAKIFYQCTECGRTTEAYLTIEHPIWDENIEITLCLDCADSLGVLGEWYERTVGYNPEDEDVTDSDLKVLVASYNKQTN